MPDRSEHSIPLGRLEEAVARGVITADQLNALRAMAALDTTDADRPNEARRGLNAVTIAYYVGAAAVVFAFGWFIVDRWQVLGPGGILGLSLLYAAIFAFTSRYLGRLGFHTASSMAALLAVAMTPLVAWSTLDLTGWWYEPGPYTGTPYFTHVDVLESVRWIPLDLATALAALVALRRVRFAILALPVAVVLPVVIGHAMPLLVDPDVTAELGGWVMLLSAAVVLACGYFVDQHPRDDEDYARWVYLTGLATLSFAVLATWSWAGPLRHALPALALALFALSLFLRRPMFVVFGAIGFIGYLAYLAFDVFRSAVSFPIVLATFGIAVIVITVSLQRRYPALARQVEARQAGQRAVPHAALVFGGAIVVAAALLASRIPGARERAADSWTRARRTALEMHRRQARVKPSSDRLQAVPTVKR